MKIIVIGSLAHSLVNFRGSLLLQLQQLGHEILTWAGDPDPHTTTWLKQHHIPFQSLPCQSGQVHPSQDVRLLLSLLHRFRRYRPDCVLSYTIKPVIYGSWAAHLQSIPNIFSIITGLGSALAPLHSSRTSAWLPATLSAMYRHSLSYNRGVFFQNPDDLAWFRERKLLAPTTSTFCIAGSGVDLNHFVPQPIPSLIPSQAFSSVSPVLSAASSAVAPQPLRFLLMGRMLYDKGIAEYVQAARYLKMRYPAVHFGLLGPLHPHPSAIPAAVIQQWTADGVIEYFGLQQDVRPFLAQASVYVLPSYREGTPRSVLEAMATGRPIITTDTAGCRETVQHGYNGYLVPVRDVPALVSAMEQMIQHPERIPVMGQHSLELVRRRFDVRQVNTDILQGMGLLS